MSWLLLVGRSYLWPRRRHLPDTTLLLPSLGLTVGIAALITVMTGMNSFQRILIEGLQEISSYHLRVTRPQAPLELGQESLFQRVAQLPAVKNLTVFIEAPMLLSTPAGKQVIPLVRAVHPEGFLRDAQRRKAMQLLPGGRYFEGERQIIIGSALSFTLGVQPGDQLQLLSLNYRPSGGLVELSQTFTVQAIYRSSSYDLEQNLVFIPLHAEVLPFFAGQQLTLGLKLEQPRSWRRLLPALQALAGEDPFKLISTYEYNRGFFTALRTEKTVLLLLVSIIFLVMVMQIYQSLRRLVLQHRKEIAVLRAFGATAGEVQGIFMWQSLLVALVSNAIGSGLGLLLAFNLPAVLRSIGRWTQMGTSTFANLPSGLQWGDVCLINVLVLLFCLVAGHLAVRPMAGMLPADILRYE